jgi:hypothetical protein
VVSIFNPPKVNGYSQSSSSAKDSLVKSIFIVLLIGWSSSKPLSLQPQTSSARKRIIVG